MRSSRICVWCLIVLVGAYLVPSSIFAKEIAVASAAEIEKAAPRPGDVLVMKDGNWADQAIVFRGAGTKEAEITLRAATPGGVILTGASSLEIDGEHLVVSGIALRECTAKDGINLKGNNCRLTECEVTGCAAKFFVHIFGTDNRMDHCALAGKTTESPTLQIEATGEPNRHRIDANYFGPRPPLGRNGGETIRVGYSHQSMNEAQTVVEQNLFDRCDGELEIISNKSCGNIYRRNTFLDCAGTLTLRHGNRCLVEGNFFLGHHKPDTAGIRVIGEDHTIVNNYVDGVARGGFWITAGIANSPLNGYFQAKNCVIAFNTVIDSGGMCVELEAGLGTSGRTLRPEKITIANNLFVVGPDQQVLVGKEGEGAMCIGNMTTASARFAEQAGIAVVDPLMARDAAGLWRPTAGSPVRGAAQGAMAVESDIDGQPRGAPLDIGCDQLSSAPVLSHPLTPAEVGPTWGRSSR